MTFLKNLKPVPFEAGCGLYAIGNGFLSLNTNSVFLDSLWHLIGGTSIAAVFLEIIAGVMTVVGIGFRKANIEVAGLAIICSSFLTRAWVLLTDGDVTLSDLNTAFLGVLILGCSLTRVITILQNQFRCKS